ncbi:hypothetical protein HDU87_008788 [Geranomyces variabilis]|uniref:Uncharacterized protein n=1 Tax=Geranomyces variabilis TaxID=109894 RepID=A0AAD5TEX8_9FUNG|nr:hypothetical protein HDU87_008788 [Geranomyces variabilis]
MPPPAKHMKRQKPAPAAKESSKPTTAEEAVEEALALEDKGDRYASGPKAVRFYQRACEMYAHAHALDAADLDVPYNWGRLLLILAEFSEPEFEPKAKHGLFKDAAARLRSGDPRNADCQFNLAQALRGLAEVVLEGTEVGGGQREAVAALTEADAVLAAVYQLQKTAYEAPPPETANEAETSEDPAESQVATLVDTLSAHAQTLTMLFKEVAEPEASILYERARQRLAAAQGILDSVSAEMLSAHDKTQVQIDIYIRHAEVLAARADVTAQVAHRVDSETFGFAVENLSRALDLAEGNNVEALCEKGDVLCSWADAVKTANGGLDKILIAEQPSSAAADEGSSSSSSSAHPTSSPTSLSTLRSLYTRAVESYTAAYTIEQSSASIATTLGNTHLLRVPLHSADERVILAENAEKYYRRAAVLGDRSVLTALAKALSWSGKEADCKKVLIAWAKNGQEESGDETAEIGFAEIVAQWEWFDAAIAGQM